VLRQILAVCSIALLAGLCSEIEVLHPLRNFLGEIRFAAFPHQPSGAIVLVDIDAKSIAALGQWPWRRRIHADIIDALGTLEAAEIAFDIDFSARSSEADDAALEAALRRAQGSVVLAAFHQRLTSEAHDHRIVTNRPLDQFREQSWLGSVNVHPDPDGQVRCFSYGEAIDGESVPSIPAIFGGSSVRSGAFPIDFSIQGSAIERISAVDLLQGRVTKQQVAGKKIIVGATAIELRDYYQVPAQGLMSGAVMQAIAAETLLQGRVLADPGRVSAYAGLALLAFLVIVAAHIDWKVRLLGIVSAAIALEAAAAMLQALYPVALDTSGWHAMLIGSAVLTTGLEIGLRRILLAISSTEARNNRILLDQVITDNFDGIVVADLDGIIHSVSRSAIQTFHADEASDWHGKPLRELVPETLVNPMMRAIADACEGNSIDQQPRELSLHLPGIGERTLEYVITPSRLKGGLSLAGTVMRDRFVTCLTFRDITERRLAEKRLAYLARFDTLTCLPNRNAFIERLGETVADDSCSSWAVLYFDLDRFKTINDTFGHGVGDQLLEAVAERGLVMLPQPHVLARFGGDEFAVLWTGSCERVELEKLAAALIDCISKPYDVSGHRLAIGTSIGIASSDDGTRDIATIMKNADTALYLAKRDGGRCFRFFDVSMDIALQARQKLEMDLRDALANRELEVHYQPQFDLSSHRLTGVEALLRWRHPERGFVPPVEFVPVAEEIGLMETIGAWVLRQACADVACWPQAIKLAVNVSPVQFVRGDLITAVDEALAESGLPAEQLEIEITESLFIQDNNAVRAIMESLGARGIEFALDDFGTGYSSLSYIRKFPISKIKIDRSFVSGIPHDGEAVAIVQAVVALAASLGIRTNAEGLETAEQIKLLHLLGCTEGQGFGLGKPQPAESLIRLLSQPNEGATGVSHPPGRAYGRVNGVVSLAQTNAVP
jgi:diguanylate cyclase (GGDEF)-like protein